jgi:peptidoglycan/xylan/chitin deacetylase (PgdA/CDA1 family)
VSKLKVVVLLLAFVAFFGLSYTALQMLPQWGTKIGKQTAGIVPPVDVLKGPAPALPDAGGRGATRDLSKIVQAYRQQDELPKASPADAGDALSTGTAMSRPAGVAPVRTPPPTVKLIREWPTGKKRVALTFDDGPHPGYTPKFLALLAEKNVKATFFLLGPNVQKQPDVVRDMAVAGHEVANHSWSHPILSKLPPEKIRNEIERTSQEIAQASGAQVRFLRPPYGSANKKVQDMCDSLGLRIVCWSIDTDDWRKTTTKEKMIETIKKNVHDGSIILMHDRSDKTYETTAEIIDALRGQGYEFVTVAELLGFPPQPRQVAEAPAAPPAAAPGPSAVAPVAAAPASPSPTASQQAAARVAPSPARIEVPAIASSSPAPSAGAAGQDVLPPVSPEKITRPPVPASAGTR